MTETEVTPSIDWDAEIKKLKVHRICVCQDNGQPGIAFCGRKTLGIARRSFHADERCRDCDRQVAVGHRCRLCGMYWPPSS